MTKEIQQPERGPKNVEHKTYRTNEKRIDRVICRKVAERSINVKACDIYRDANLTSPTFYNHYQNSNEALKSYERKLRKEFHQRASGKSNRRDFYMMLVSYVGKNRMYFAAAADGGSCYLLRGAIAEYRVILVGRDTGDRSFEAYMGTIIAIINFYLKNEKHSAEIADEYSKHLARINPVRWW